MPTKQQLRQAVASHLYDSDLSVREVAGLLGVSVGKAHQLKKAWEKAGEVPASMQEVAAEIKSAMEACTPQQVASREDYAMMLSALSGQGVPRASSNLGDLGVRPSRHSIIDQARKVVSGTTEERIAALTVQLVQWAGVTQFSDVTFEQIYKFCREVCPNTQRRNDLFLAWMESQTYPGNPKGEDVVVADSPTPAEPETAVEVLQVATEEEIIEAQKWANTVLHRYDTFRLHSDHGNLIEIARNKENLFAREQVERAQAFVDNPLLGKRPGE